jgi:hypothetical protein
MALVDLHRPTILRAIALQVAITLPPVLVTRALTQDDAADESYLPLVAVVIALLVAPAIAGAYAAWQQPRVPLLHAGVTTALAWFVLALVTVIRLAAIGHGALDAAIVLPLFALIEVGVGICSAYLTHLRRRDTAS